MDMNTKYTIDLENYGMSGEITLSAPSFRRMIEMKNAMSKSARLSARANGVDVQNVLSGDMQLLQILVYVENAPFRRDTESFLDYCDRIDAKENGMAERLFEDMVEQVKKIDSGEASPLVDSADAGMSSSE